MYIRNDQGDQHCDNPGDININHWTENVRKRAVYRYNFLEDYSASWLRKPPVILVSCVRESIRL